MSSKVRDEIPNPFPNFNGATIEVWERIKKIFPHHMIWIITYPFLDLSLPISVKRGWPRHRTGVDPVAQLVIIIIVRGGVVDHGSLRQTGANFNSTTIIAGRKIPLYNVHQFKEESSTSLSSRRRDFLRWVLWFSHEWWCQNGWRM